jgi:hypothetical protein
MQGVQATAIFEHPLQAVGTAGDKAAVVPADEESTKGSPQQNHQQPGRGTPVQTGAQQTDQDYATQQQGKHQEVLGRTGRLHPLGQAKRTVKTTKTF